jgi:hypothetical protein
MQSKLTESEEKRTCFRSRLEDRLRRQERMESSSVAFGPVFDFGFTDSDRYGFPSFVLRSQPLIQYSVPATMIEPVRLGCSSFSFRSLTHNDPLLSFVS